VESAETNVAGQFSESPNNNCRRPKFKAKSRQSGRIHRFTGRTQGIRSPAPS